MNLKTLLKAKTNFFKLMFNVDKLLATQNEVLLISKENEWANIYHDSIRGKDSIEKLPLNIGRWAGNYSFFYVLNRILSDYKPNRILELGLGESSKFISTYIDNYLLESKHWILEHDIEWINAFNNKFSLSKRSEILKCSLITKEIKGHQTYFYDDFEDKIFDKFDLYIIDGPFGSERFSRYNIISIVERFTVKDEFIIIMDDTNRKGENDTKNDIISLLKDKKIVFYIGEYRGFKNVTLISTGKYKFSTTF